MNEPGTNQTTELPAFDRLRLRVLVGTLCMLELQVAELTEPIRDHVFGSNASFVTAWQQGAVDLRANTTDAPADVAGPKTMGAA